MPVAGWIDFVAVNMEIGPVNWLSVDLTSDCSMRCRYCSVSAGEIPVFNLPVSHAASFFDYFSTYAIPNIKLTFSGGEPTVHPRAVDILDLALDRFIDPRIFLLTNGFFSPSLLDKLLKRDIKFQITFEGLPGIQDFERPAVNGGKTSDVVLRNIKKILKEKPDSLFVRMNYSPLKFGREEEIADFLGGLGVERLAVGILTERGRGKEYEHVDSIESLKRVKYLVKVMRDRGIKALFPEFTDDPGDWVSCGAGKTFFALSADSLITGCQGILLGSELPDREKLFVFGRVDEDGVKIDRKRHEAFIDFAYSVPEKCTTCPARKICSCPMIRLTGRLCDYVKTQLDLMSRDKE